MTAAPITKVYAWNYSPLATQPKPPGQAQAGARPLRSSHAHLYLWFYPFCEKLL